MNKLAIFLTLPFFNAVLANNNISDFSYYLKDHPEVAFYAQDISTIETVRIRKDLFNKLFNEATKNIKNERFLDGMDEFYFQISKKVENNLLKEKGKYDFILTLHDAFSLLSCIPWDGLYLKTNPPQYRILINGGVEAICYNKYRIGTFGEVLESKETNNNDSYEIHFCAPRVNPDFYVNGKYQGIEYAIIPQNTEFEVNAELIMQFDKWSLISYQPFLLIAEKYFKSIPGFVPHGGFQQWKLKSTIPGDYYLVFERIVNNETQQKIISVHVQ